MKYTIFFYTLGLLSVSSALHAQAIKPDYVITSSGDTIVGQIKYPDEGKVSIRPDGEKKYLSFKPEEAPEYYVGRYNETYLSATLAGKTKRIYLLCIERGAIDAFRVVGYYDQNGYGGMHNGSGIGIGAGGGSGGLGIGVGVGINLSASKATALYVRKGQDPAITINSKQWFKSSKEKRKEKLGELMTDDPDLMQEMLQNDSSFNDDFILNYVKDYNARKEKDKLTATY